MLVRSNLVTSTCWPAVPTDHVSNHLFDCPYCAVMVEAKHMGSLYARSLLALFPVRNLLKSPSPEFTDL
jgi:hypothetical protein